LATYRFEGCLDAWVMTVVKNCHRLWRDRQPGGPKAVDFVPLDSTGEPAASLASASGGSYDSDSVNPERSTLNRERHRLLYEAIKSLPPQEYRCTILRVRHDLSVKQIAHSLRLAEGTVKAHLSHAREKLRSELGSLFSNIDF
jgi:RNA polymerase sigma factor (sigma-70 family)